MRQELQRISTTCADGINQSAEDAGRNQCTDARNVWAPNGRVEQRPGYVGVFCPGFNDSTGYSSDVGVATILENNATAPPTYTTAAPVTLDNAVARTALRRGDRVYFGLSDIYPTLDRLCSVLRFGGTANSNSTLVEWSYWNGEAWVGLKVGMNNYTNLLPIHNFKPADLVFSYVQPNDWASSTVDARTRYFIRCELLSADIDAACEIGFTAGYNNVEALDYLFQAQFANNKRWLAKYLTSVNTTIYTSANTKNWDNLYTVTLTTNNSSVEIPPSFTVVPEAGEAYVSTGEVLMFKKDQLGLADGVSGTTVDDVIATVENRDFAVGPGAPYDRSYIDQLSTFPQGKCVLYWRGRMWVAGFDEFPDYVRWSAATPYYKVFPTLSTEPVGQGDGDKVMALAGLGEHVVVLKQRSLWIMVPREVNAFGLTVYIPVKKADVGTTAPNSVTLVDGKLIFLSAKGLYSFDGVSAVPLSVNQGVETLGDFYASINANRVARSVGIDWLNARYYLLAVPTDGNFYNDKVLVYDYDAGAFWIWDSIEATSWILEDGHLYFADRHGQIYEFGKGHTDHGAPIESYVVPAFFQLNSRNTSTLREVRVTSEQLCQSLKISVLRNGDDADDVTAHDLDFTDSAEAVFDTAVFDTDKYTVTRRRKERLDVRSTGDTFQVKVAHTVKGTPWALTEISLGFQAKGQR